MNKIRPQDDFYMYKNKEWLEQAVIPDDKPLIGSFVEILINNEKILMEDLARFAANGVDKSIYNDPLFDRFMVLYKKAINHDQRIKDGNGFFKDVVSKIDRVKDYKDLEDLLINFLKQNMPDILPIGVSPDMKNADMNTLYMGMPGIILPDKSYYDETNQAYQKGRMLLQKYEEVVTDLFNMIGLDNAKETIQKAFLFDKILVPISKSAEESADYIANYNPYNFDELSELVNPLSLKRIVSSVISEEVKEIIVTNPRYVKAFKDVITDNLELIKAFLKVKFVYGYAQAGYGTNDLREKAASYNMLLTGQKEATSFEKYTYNSLSNLFGDVVGLYFGHRYFGEKAKKDIENMVAEFISVYKKRLKANDWLSAETREKAIVKLNKITAMIGYPEEIHDIYKIFIPDENKSYVENRFLLDQASVKEHFAKYNKKTNKKLWGMGAHIVNAYYNPNSNVIVFPAGILQYPFYDYNQPKGANYGGIGAVIAHEITHAFDTNGAKIDENGNINNWWKEEDFKKFDEKAEEMIALFDGLEIPGTNAKCNGKLTVTENIADAGGLSCAYEAGLAHADFNPKDFFDGWASIWRIKAKPAYQELLANVDTHSPGYLRGKVQLMNFAPFAKYYDVKKEDGMYLDPKKFISIW